jgi:uncharacterized protein with von Willebrand factor type A (vWA) domain
MAELGPEPFRVEAVALDVPAVAGAFGRALREAGVPCGVDRSERFARALTLVRPVSRRRLYCTARAVFVSDPSQTAAFDAVFAQVFGGGFAALTAEITDDIDVRAVQSTSADERPVSSRTGVEAGVGSTPSDAAPSGGEDGEAVELPVAVAPSDEEVLRERRFDALSPGELASLYHLMSELAIATPLRRTRRARRDRHGSRVDVRRTLRASLRTGGDPVAIARRRRRVLPRRMVLLCDISGSMEPYTRAYLQFLTSAARSGPRVETFTFATRLTRLTRALAARHPERAMRRAAAAAPDWSSGTRIGMALKTFNDRHGRRGMARGAVVVILSDGWERGDPELVSREMARLSRLAHRIVWVNPRLSAPGFSPRVGGMAAALPYCDALVSGHSLGALEEVVAAIGGAGSGWEGPLGAEEDEPWPSAVPEPGSSVAMPSGYGPSRGRTTPGWTLHP